MLRLVTVLVLSLGLTPAMADTVPEPALLVIEADSVVQLPGSNATIRLTGVQDVRCPSDVDCYWEGLIKITLTLTDAEGTLHDITLCNMCDEATREALALGLRITFTRLEPGRNVLDDLNRPVQLSDYTVFVTVAPQ